MGVPVRFFAPLLLGLLLFSCQISPTSSRNVALVYGVSTYDAQEAEGGGTRSTPNLQFPVLDVQALTPLLSTDTGGAFTVTARIDQAATKAQLTADIAAAASTLNSESVFVYFSIKHFFLKLTGFQASYPDLTGFF